MTHTFQRRDGRRSNKPTHCSSRLAELVGFFPSRAQKHTRHHVSFIPNQFDNQIIILVNGVSATEVSGLQGRQKIACSILNVLTVILY